MNNYQLLKKLVFFLTITFSEGRWVDLRTKLPLYKFIIFIYIWYSPVTMIF